MTIQEFLADHFDCPCDYTPIDEKMWEFCGNKCDETCYYGKKCWEQVFKAYGITNVTEEQHND